LDGEREEHPKNLGLLDTDANATPLMKMNDDDM